MRTKERRCHRSKDLIKALELQLAACQKDAELEAMVLGDEDGLCLAWAGDDPSCQEITAHLALMNHKVENFEGVILAPERKWHIRMRRFDAEGSPLFVCAVGGGGERRGRELHRSVAGVTRILATV